MSDSLPTHNLGADETSFVGRAQALRELTELWTHHARLVTLLGPAGMGKTRLSRRCAYLQTREARWDAVLFCALDVARSEDDLCAALARVLDVELGASHNDPVAHLGQALHRLGHALVVLDNLEQFTPIAANAIARWLDDAPQLRMLVTSRERLRLSDEAVYELSPLSIPDQPSGLEDTEAVQLFIERARAVRPNLALTPDNLQAVARLVQRLDGIPLAIELAAARARVLSPTSLLDRIDQRFRILRAPARFSDPRQATLWGALDWSWQLMTPAERRALAQCAVFHSGFSLDAFEALTRDDDDPTADPLDLLESLRDKSLVHVRPHADPDGALRFGLYESIRAFAEHQLPNVADPDATWRRYATWTLDSATRWASLANGPDGALARAHLDIAREDLMAVLHHALDLPDDAPDAPQATEDALRALLALQPLVTYRGPFAAYSALWLRAVERPLVAHTPTLLRLRALRAWGNLQRMRGRLDEAIATLQRALDAWTADPLDATAPRLGPGIHADLGIALHERGRLDDAQRHYATAQQRFEALDAQRAAARVLGSLAILYEQRGDLANAETTYHNALAATRRIGDRRVEAITLNSLGDLYHEQHHDALAQEHYTAAIEVARQIGDRRIEAVGLGNLGGLHQDRGELDDALSLRLGAASLLAEIGDMRLEGVFTGYAGEVEHLRDQPAQAVLTYRRAVARLRDAGDARFGGWFSACLGAAEADLGRLDAAQDALDHAQTQLADLAAPGLLEAVALLRLRLKLARAIGDPAQRRERASEAHAALDAISDASDATRFARALLKRALERAKLSPNAGDAPASPAASTLAPAAAPSAVIATPATSEPPLHVLDHGQRFVLPDGTTIDFGRTRAPKFIFARLVQHRLQAPGESLSVFDLVEAGWPGQQLHPESGTNRVYVAVNDLRKKRKLDPFILYRDDGYLLDPKLPITHDGSLDDA